MISKDEKQILKAYRKLKEYGAKNIVLADTDKYIIEGFTLEEIETLIKERDYYKQRYLEFNDYFIKNNMTIEQMLKELKRSKLYEKGGNI